MKPLLFHDASPFSHGSRLFAPGVLVEVVLTDFVRKVMIHFT